jgi:cytidyltransferase-like protein
LEYQSIQGQGVGGLDAHVRALNADRDQRGLSPVRAIHVTPWPMGASAVEQQENHVLFLDDEVPTDTTANGDDGVDDVDNDQLIGGVKVPSEYLFDHVAVGGTFDGMHYGHRKLLTLAVSSVSPTTGKLTIGVTVDEMLQKKAYADQIPDLQERMDGTRDFIYRLAPGIKNRVKLLPISDAYGPPGTLEHGTAFDALVLSHETLENGCKLNEYRKTTLGLGPLALLCTRRTEPHGMSSTALRRRKWEKRQRKLQSQVPQ